MDDLISRKEAIDAVHKTIYGFFDIVDDDSDEPFTKEEERFLAINKAITTRIKSLPSAQPERKTGEWTYGEDESGQDGWTCSKCGFFVPWYYDYYGLNNIDFIRDFHTCPHCDAKMLTYTGKKMEVEHEN